jgi:8-amino-7-oxononanoate synthase/dethiobiotin synthase
MRALIVTGTDTGVGKTVLTAALAAMAHAAGRRVAVVKPVQTGVARGEPGDLDEVRRLSGVTDLHELARFPDPLAPATAARRAGTTPPSVRDIAERIRRIDDRDLVLVEGAGGLLVQLDAGGGTIGDLATALDAPTLVVARAGLGTLNATALTCEALRQRGAECLGVVIGAWPREPDLAALCNLEDVARYAGAPVLGMLPERASELGRAEFIQAAADGLTGLCHALELLPSEGALSPLRRASCGSMTDIVDTLEALRSGGLYRQMRVVESEPGPRVIVDGREAVLLCSNDYLGLAAHPRVRAAAAEAAERWGAGAGASRLVSGNMAIHRRLESELADFKGYESCVLFGSGFLANTGVIGALAGPGELILSDALNHASIVDGCRQSRAETIVYEHCDLDALDAALRRRAGRGALVVTDAVFSMDGDVAPLAGIVELADRHGARVLVDEAHATGVVGPGGRGLVAALGLERDVDVVIGTLSKALGSYGAFVCCSTDMAEFLVNRARTLIFSTGLPPACVAAASAALEVVREDPAIIERLWANARLLRQALRATGFSVAGGEMPIIPLVLGDPRDAMALSDAALERGVFAQAIRPPTVPEGTSRLRLVAMATHSEQDLRDAAAALAAARSVIEASAAAQPSA